MQALLLTSGERDEPRDQLRKGIYLSFLCVVSPVQCRFVGP